MPQPNAKRETRFPTRGVPGGWRDIWDDPDDSAALRAQGEAVERRQEAFAAVDGPRWRAEAVAERRERQREQRRVR